MRAIAASTGIVALGAAASLFACGVDDELYDGSLGTLAAAESRAVVGPVTVRVLGRMNDGAPIVAGIPVLFYTPSGALFRRTTTDASGVAIARAIAGGAVTVVEPAGRRLTTIYGIEPGDELTVGDVGFWGPAPIGDATVHVPPGPDPVANEYYVDGPCAMGSSSSTEVPMLLWSGCALTRPMLATARQPGYGALTGYLLDPEVTLEVGGTATLDGAWSPPTTFDLTVTGFAGGGVNFVLERYLGSQSVFRSATGALDVSDGTASGRFDLPGGGDGTMVQFQFGFPEFPYGENYILEYRSGQVTTWASDLSGDYITRTYNQASVLGELSPHGPIGPIGGDWSIDPSNDADGIVVRIFAVDADFIDTSWIAILPPGTQGYRLPRLPADLLHVWAGRQFSFWEVHNVDTPASSYREFRRDAEPEWPWKWMRAPTGPSKVRIGN